MLTDDIRYYIRTFLNVLTCSMQQSNRKAIITLKIGGVVVATTTIELENSSTASATINADIGNAYAQADIEIDFTDRDRPILTTSGKACIRIPDQNDFCVQWKDVKTQL